MDSGNENITYRNVRRTSSLTDLTILTDDKHMFDTTMMSIPDSLHDNSDIVSSDIKEQNKNLKIQLQSAHQEIENLNNENYRLKCDIQDMLKKLNTYKKLFI